MTADRIFLGYETAFWIWRKAGASAFAFLKPTRVRTLAGGAPTQAKANSFKSNHPDLATKALDVVVQYGDQRAIPETRVHVTSKALPDRSFYRLDEGVYVASPELTLFQLASKLTEPQALKLAMEMCGSYAIDQLTDDFYDDNPYLDDEDSEGVAKRPPLTSPQKLKSYAARLYKPDSRAHGVKFLRWLVGGSASPRETALCMLLCMPPRFGGYGLKLPELNRRIELTKAEQLMVGAHHFDCDLFWHDEHLAVEYDSKAHHTAAEKQERDAIRRNMLQYKDVQVITATRLQVNKAGQFDKLARQIAHEVGKRMRPPTQNHVAMRNTLRNTLFSWDALSDNVEWRGGP